MKVLRVLATVSSEPAASTSCRAAQRPMDNPDSPWRGSDKEQSLFVSGDEPIGEEKADAEHREDGQDDYLCVCETEKVRDWVYRADTAVRSEDQENQAPPHPEIGTEVPKGLPRRKSYQEYSQDYGEDLSTEQCECGDIHNALPKGGEVSEDEDSQSNCGSPIVSLAERGNVKDEVGADSSDGDTPLTAEESVSWELASKNGNDHDNLSAVEGDNVSGNSEPGSSTNSPAVITPTELPDTEKSTSLDINVNGESTREYYPSSEMSESDTSTAGQSSLTQCEITGSEGFEIVMDVDEDNESAAEADISKDSESVGSADRGNEVSPEAESYEMLEDFESETSFEDQDILPAVEVTECEDLYDPMDIDDIDRSNNEVMLPISKVQITSMGPIITGPSIVVTDPEGRSFLALAQPILIDNFHDFGVDTSSHRLSTPEAAFVLSNSSAMAGQARPPIASEPQLSSPLEDH